MTFLLITACQPIQPGQPTSAASPQAALSTAVPTSTQTPTTIPSPQPTSPPSAVTQTVTPTRTPEPSGCFRPPEDYTRVEINGFRLNQRTVAMLLQARRLYRGEIDLLGSAMTQGSYNQGVSASFGTHDAGGAIDLSVMRAGTYTVLEDDILPLLAALRQAGFAAWLRDLDELGPGSPIHIHAIAIGDRELSPAAQEQLTGTAGYFRGFDGLPVENSAPGVDRYGGPVICDWMIDAGYTDLLSTPIRTDTPSP